SDYSISPKPATKRFLIFRIELLILIDDLSAHRTPPCRQTKVARTDCERPIRRRCVNYFTLRRNNYTNLTKARGRSDLCKPACADNGIRPARPVRSRTPEVKKPAFSGQKRKTKC